MQKKQSWCVVFPGVDTSPRGSEGRIWPDDFWQNIFLGGLYNRLANAIDSCSWRWPSPVYSRLSLQFSLTIACIKALSKTLAKIHGASHVPAPRLTPTSTCWRCWLIFSTAPQGRIFSKIIRPNSSFGAPEGSISKFLFFWKSPVLAKKQKVLDVISFFLSLVWKTHANHWTKWMLNTWLTTKDPRNCSGPEDKGYSSF